jgi:prepilin-type N-terminal cleavage/methylation domain-containing protein
LTLRGHWLGGREKNAFTLVEVVVAMSIVGIVMAALLMLLSQSAGLVASNTGYTAAQRGVLSSVEFLSKEISSAGEVEIVSDDTHDLAPGLDEEWHYVVLSSDRKEVRHVYQREDGSVAYDKVPGSEYIETISFDAEPRTEGLDGVRRLLRIFVKAAYGPEDAVKTVGLDRSILVHAAMGVMGLDASAPEGGHILRYRPRTPLLTPGLEVYGSRKISSKETFEYASPDTWKHLEGGFNYDTELDAHLTLPAKFVNAVESTGEDVIFTWIAADPTIFEDIVKSAGRNPEAILTHLEERVPNYLEAEVGQSLLDTLYEDQQTHEDDETLSMELEAKLINDPFNIQDPDSAAARGFRLMSVKEGTKHSDSSNVFEVELSDNKKFNLGAVASTVTRAYDLYRGAYMIIVASFPDGKGSRKKWPVYVKSGNYKDDVLFADILDQLQAGTENTNLNDRTYLNTQSKYGNMTLAVDQNTGRRYFEVRADTSGSVSGPLVMLKFGPEDFAHMIPKGAASSADVLYGPTNYAVYIDIELPDVGAGGGFGVLLNGSRVNKTYQSEYRSGGYIFQFDPGANGFVIRYYCYNDNVYGERGVNGDGGSLSWGARPMYFYDAAKSKFPAPGNISLSGPVTSEDFNKNAGASSDAGLYYRLPFSVGGGTEYINQITGTNIFSASMEGRNDRYYQDRIEGSHVGYGMMYGQDQGYISLYSPKHMQSWHLYDGTTVGDMLTEGEEDNRLGFRWDRSWNIHFQKNDRPDDPNYNISNQREIWQQRHILKLTVLEVTRNIQASEVEDEWNFKIHHGGETDINKVTPLADSWVHKAGDIFIRAELIGLKKGATDWNNSRNYIYSKPIWYGKFKGDAWRGDYPSPFKKLGNTMQHVVADPEPKEGDDQSYRRRGMRVRSWKESFLGWDFSKVTGEDYRYIWKQFVESLPPDFYKTTYIKGDRNNYGRVNPVLTDTPHSVWTPPIAIDLNKNNNGNKTEKIKQSSEFGQYSSEYQYVSRDARGYNGEYGYDVLRQQRGKPIIPEGSRVYGRLSILRPWRATQPNQTTPIFGLYAMRGWDFGTSSAPDWDINNNAKEGSYVSDSPGPTCKRFLTVVQGLQLPYRPKPTEAGYRREPSDVAYTPDRERILGFRFWSSSSNTSTYRLYDTWIGEGFSPREVRAILGLKDDTEDADVRGTYVDQSMEEITIKDENGFESYVPGFYVPLEGEGGGE